MSILGKQKVFLVVLRIIVLGVLLQVVRKHKRNRVLTALLLPAAAVLLIIGWGLSLIGTQKRPRKATVKPQKDNVQIGAIVFEEPTEISN